MGVTGLWKVVEHCARPTKIETLNKKRLAVDASIWIYQFLKAVRDKEGNALRNSHVVGFFRRICKLLFVGILPVFVFDGGAPALKRQTINARKSRREGRREDAAQTASKLLAREMQRMAEEEDRRRKDAAQKRSERADDDDEEALPETLVYADEINMTEQEVQNTRKFKKTDQYHLPELHTSIAEMGAPDDPRVMSLEELETYARQFDSGEDINVYDFSKIDFDSPFFTSLPASDRYNILNAARLRSRLRMGHSKEQLDAMFPDRMAFSKFQIERVRERNELTQRLMNINGMNDGGMFGAGGAERIAGEKGREYVLVRNDGVEGGWALGVVSNKEEGKESRPIDIDKKEIVEQSDANEETDDSDAFEDVPIEGLNRLPKLPAADVSRRSNPRHRHGHGRGATSRSGRRRTTAKRSAPKRATSDINSLFVQPEKDTDDVASEQSLEDDEDSLFGSEDEQEQLDHAIAMSLQQEQDLDSREHDRNEVLDAFQQSRAEESRPLPKGSGKATAHILNSRAGKSGPKPTFIQSKPDEAEEDSDDEQDDMDFQKALEISNNRAQQQDPQKPTPAVSTTPKPSAEKSSGFSGPLPFERLDLGSSLLGKKKMAEIKSKTEGGFEKPGDKAQKKSEAQPLPPWFVGDIGSDIQAQRKLEQSDRDKAKAYAEAQKFEFQQPSILHRSDTGLVIDLESPSKAESQPALAQAPIEIDDDDDVGPQNDPVTLGEVADAVRASPPRDQPPVLGNEPPILAANQPEETRVESVMSETDNSTAVVENTAPLNNDDSDAPVDWSDSDHEQIGPRKTPAVQDAVEQMKSQPTLDQESVSRSPSADDFEDVEIPDKARAVSASDTPESSPRQTTASALPAETSPTTHKSGLADENTIIPDEEGENYGYYTDSEDERLMQDLATEAEEHARFASQMSHKPQQQIHREYEDEMKQLRSQQKKDRRDADEVTQIMITECQQLLRLFGLPYITAPMEAEAQCAELVRLGLVDGIVTDDSDTFLFGGTRIYKNMFNQAKLVECYLAPDLEKEYDLSRPKLIDIAQLLGSDYTEGLAGIGHVKALEILSDFATLDEFKTWWVSVQETQHVKTANEALLTTPFRRKFKRAHVNKLFLPVGFPDPRVKMAYERPEVDSDPSPFEWGVPDLVALRGFLMSTIGWSSERTDEVLVPVIRDMNRRETEGTQSNITAFMSGSAGAGGFAPRERLEAGSKRAGNALDRLAKRAKSKRK